MKIRASLAMLVLCPLVSCGNKNEQNRPNVIYILADDLGYGDLSCMGQQRFHTPNIDRLASEGLLMTRHYSGTSVSAPSRSCLITGQHTGHTPIRGNKEWPVEGQHPFPSSAYNIFEYMSDAGYATAVFGKWGLGAPETEGAPEHQGVTEFYGYNCQRIAHNYYPEYLWHNGKKVILQENRGTGEGQYAPYLYHDQALKFIRENTSSEKPFFMLYATALPHAELRLPQEEIDGCKGDFLPEKEYKGCDSGPNYKKGGYGSQLRAHAAFASMISLLDRQVGEIAALIDSLGMAENTLIIFTSDNGPHQEGGADPAFFNSSGGLRGTKRDLYEGGIRVPFIARWTGKIDKGRVSEHVSAFWDFYPTMVDLVGIPLKEQMEMDGISYLPTLLGAGEQAKHDCLYWEFHELNGRQAALRDNWKAVRYDVAKGGRIQLYDISQDPAETNDLAEQYPEIVRDFEKIMCESRTDSELFRFISL